MRCDEATKAKTVCDVPMRFSSSTSTWYGDDDDNSTYIEVTIRYLDKEGNERIIGKIRLFYLDLGAAFETNDSVHDLFQNLGRGEYFV